MVTVMEHYQINKFLSLKLEKDSDGRLVTNIYVDGKKFIQCKFLLIEIPFDEAEMYDNFNSIDEIIRHNRRHRYHPFHDTDPNYKKLIPPETEFWGHCSNLEAWYENGYDTRLLTQSLSFPLLKALEEAGDLVASQVIKQEAFNRLSSGEQFCHDFMSGESLKSQRCHKFAGILGHDHPDFGSFAYTLPEHGTCFICGNTPGHPKKKFFPVQPAYQ